MALEGRYILSTNKSSKEASFVYKVPNYYLQYNWLKSLYAMLTSV